MRQYLARRLLLLVPVLLLVSAVIFIMMRVLPGDAALVALTSAGEKPTPERLAEVRAEMGLDRPVFEQYLRWVGGLVRLDAGVSTLTGQPVTKEIAQRFPVTFELAMLGVLVSLLIAIPLGTLSALRQDSWMDYGLRVVAIGGIAMPTFWVGTLILLMLVRLFGWMPPLGFKGLFDDPGRNFQQLVWPAIVLGFNMAAIVTRMTRSQMLEVLRQDYVRTAWAKGLRERVVVYRHALKNALLPVVTLVGIQSAHLLGGTVIIETIFVVPGMGSYLVNAIAGRDYPVTQTVIVVFSLVTLLANLGVDILYGWLDPRIRYAG